MNKIGLSTICGLSALLPISAMSAEETEQGAAIHLPAGIDFSPSALVEFRHDDNITNASIERVQSWVVTSRANMLFEAKHDADSYRLEYAVEKGAYLDSKIDNYLDHDLLGGAKWELSDTVRLAVDGRHQSAHEGRGSNFSQGIGAELEEPDTFLLSDVSVSLSYGPDTSPVRLDTSLGADRLDYYGGIRTQDRDRRSAFGALTLRFKTGAKTELVGEVSHRSFKYEFLAPGQQTLDSTESDYLVGLNWEGAKTVVRIRGGVRSKQFDSDQRADFSGARWDGSIAWKPRTYSTIEVASDRRTEEVQGEGDYIDIVSHSLSWNHEWSDLISSEILHSLDQAEYSGELGIPRDEDYQRSTVSLSYRMRYWLALSIGYERQQQDAVDARLNYDRNISYIGFKLSI
ncbi:outer membrane beta-barrel protein [Microbulbifer magnicolonia]|uniref:outer membrane beta-barrel protein n=1 Tax=Microbulbifer magnicolonia TaxID=3109744 RepID=UPI002B40065C|nr:outer membrane beta-barrel protein [Microbulbifer sp. GG15]